MSDKPSVKAKTSDKAVAVKGSLKTTDDEDEGKKRKGPVAWLLGWVALPGMVLGGIFGGGVLIGANFHESWFVRAFVWLFSW